MKNRNLLLAPAALGLSLLLALTTAPLGCGDDGDGDSSLSLAQYCPELLKVFCETRIACYSEAALDYEGYTTINECVNALGDLCQGQPEGWEASIAAGRKEYQADKANGCFAAVRASSCDELSFTNTSLLDECEAVFTSLVPADGDCTAWAGECAEGLWCEPTGFPRLSCKTGTCAAAEAVGSVCNLSDLICEAGLTCACGAGDDCTRDEDPDPRTCHEATQENQDCSRVACRAGLFCGSDTKCHKISLIGAACDDSLGDGDKVCDAYSYCTDGTCVGRPKVGDACGGDILADCWGGWCDPAEGKCVVHPSVGGTCTYETSITCIGGYCDTTDATCKALKAVGADCNTGSECSTAICSDDTGKCVEEYCPS